jgi:hypothetical protein
MKELQKLPEPLAKEVLDFIEFIEFKHGLRDQEIRELRGMFGTMPKTRSGITCNPGENTYSA